MVSNRKKPPFWQRKSTRRKHDIAVLRPESLPRGRRFETIADARRESERSQKLLGSGVKAEFLSECRAGYYQCNKTYCPICARLFDVGSSGNCFGSLNWKAGPYTYPLFYWKQQDGPISTSSMPEHTDICFANGLNVLA